MWPAIAAAVAGLLAGGGAVFLLRSRRDQIEADTAETLTRSAAGWIDKLEDRIANLEERVRELELERDAAHHATAESERRAGRLIRWTKILEAQVIERGGTPVRLEDIPD